MIQLNTLKDIQEKITDEKWILLYLSRPECGVCKSLLPKVKLLCKKYSKLKSYYIDLNLDERIAGQLSIFTIPGILVYTNGKESIREARYISIDSLKDSLDRIDKHI